MRVTVRLFAALRERAGAGRRELELPQGATAGDVFAALEIGAEPPGLAYAVNQEYAERSAALKDGDEVALIPPVSGGATPSRSSCSARADRPRRADRRADGGRTRRHRDVARAGARARATGRGS